jgi:2,4-dienoyl-CoA reductase-like NADH-dependent reductase (Old Yellow Enzyme family)
MTTQPGETVTTTRPEVTPVEAPEGRDVADGKTGAELSYIWQPLSIGPMRVKHRIMVPARVLNYSRDGIISDRHIATYRELAMGGASLIVTEQHAAHPISKGSFYMPCTAWEKQAIPQFEKFADAVHEYDCKGVVQLFGTGVHDRGTMMMDEWHPLWGVSRIPSMVHNEVPMEMEKEHIREIVKGFGDSALNVKVGGLDGVEVHGAHAYLIGQFLSPTYNNRTDEYGGSVKNRCRIAVEIGQEIREQVGGDIAVGIRLSFDEFLGPAGITPDQAEEQLEILAGTGLYDYFSISGGSYHTLHIAVAPMSVDDGHMISFAKRAKEIVGGRAKIFTVGRIRELSMAEEAVSSGAADMVAMGRAHLTDPHLVRKTREGREREVIKCIGVNECIGRLFDQREVICMMNPVSGRERQWGYGTLRPVGDQERKSVMVVGGGPAGMKVAEVAARRGHRVVLIEKEDELGGHFNLIKRLPTRESWEIAVDNLRRAVENAGVEVRLGVTATKDLLQNEAPDAVVVATGSRYDTSGLSAYRPDRDGIPGADQENVLDVKTANEMALEDPESLGQKIVIVDETAGYLPLGLAEILGRAGADVEIITPQMFVGQETFRHLEMPHLLPRLKELGVKFTAQHFVDSIDGDTVQAYGVWGSEQRTIEGVDTVVLSLYQVANDELYHELRDSFPETYRIGDCLAPRKPAAVIYEGEKLGREI